MSQTPTSHLPIIDLSRLEAGHPERAAALAELQRVARYTGFFYLSGHGIPQERIDALLALSKRFFALPEAEKRDIQMVKSPHFRGYSIPGSEYTRGEQDWREQVDFGAEREKLPLAAGDPPWKRLYGPNQYPAALPELKPVIVDYLATVTDLGIRLLKAFALALGQPEDVFEPIYASSPHQLLKIIHYPGRETTASDQGCGAHKDGGFLTILLQDTVDGLEVEGPNGWIAAPPIRGTFVINIGELLELASNGYLRANVHRVVTPPATVDRYSVAFFLGANLSATVPVLNLPPNLAAEVRGLTVDPLNPLFREVGKNVLKSRLRSHPDVARAHHADLLTADELKSPAIASAY